MIKDLPGDSLTALEGRCHDRLYYVLMPCVYAFFRLSNSFSPLSALSIYLSQRRSKSSIFPWLSCPVKWLNIIRSWALNSHWLKITPRSWPCCSHRKFRFLDEFWLFFFPMTMKEEKSRGGFLFYLVCAVPLSSLHIIS